MRRYLLLAGFAIGMHYSHAQTSQDIYQISDFSPQGSARSIGLGGVSASLGGDYTGVTTNPATLGVYRSSQGGFTLSLNDQRSRTDFEGTKNSENDLSFGFNQLYYVNSSAESFENKKDISSWSFAFGLNRVKNFNQRYVYERNGVQNTSIIDQAASDYNNGIDVDKAWYAWDVGLTDTVGQNMQTSAQPADGSRNQLKDLHLKGSITEFNFSIARNIDNEFMIGLGVSMPFGNYTQDMIFRENDPSNNFSNLSYLEYTEGLTSTLIGVNANLGILYQPEPYVRLGAWVKTPTSYAVTDTYYYNFRANVEGYEGLIGDQRSSDFIGLYDYRVVSAFKWGLSGTYLFQDKGLVSLDYMMSKPNNNKLRSKDPGYNDFERELNSAINNRYTTQHSVRLGAEARMKSLYLRFGGNFQTNPLTDDVYDQQSYGFSFGVGMRTEKMAFSLAVAQQYNRSYDQPYAVDNLTPVLLKNDYTSFVLSLGFR